MDEVTAQRIRSAWAKWADVAEEFTAATKAMTPEEGWEPKGLVDPPPSFDASRDKLQAVADSGKRYQAARREVTRLAKSAGIRTPLVPPEVGGACPV